MASLTVSGGLHEQQDVARAVSSNDALAMPPPTSHAGSRNVNELVRPRWSHLEYRWRLENFWELRALACVEALEDENGGLIWSQRFGDTEKGFWQLKLYPYGDLSPAGRGHVSLFLSLDLKSLDVPKAYAIFGCYLLDEEGQKVANSGRSFTRQKFAEGSSSWGWSQFIKVEGQSLNRLLTVPNESLIIKCEIEVFVGVMAAPGRALAMPATWEEEMKKYLINPNAYDVSLICEGRIVRGNRQVLCARSKWLDQQLNGSMKVAGGKMLGDPFGTTRDNTTTNLHSTNPNSNSTIAYASFGAPSLPEEDRQDFAPLKSTAPQTQPSDDSTLEVSDVSPEILENAVAFMHTDDCPLFSESTSLTLLLELFIASKRLDIESLYLNLIRRLCASIVSKPTAVAVQAVARDLGAGELADHCASYLLMCVRDLTDDELLKALVPKQR